jgi:hypothetical protein
MVWLWHPWFHISCVKDLRSSVKQYPNFCILPNFMHVAQTMLDFIVSSSHPIGYIIHRRLGTFSNWISYGVLPDFWPLHVNPSCICWVQPNHEEFLILSLYVYRDWPFMWTAGEVIYFSQTDQLRLSMWRMSMLMRVRPAQSPLSCVNLETGGYMYLQSNNWIT